MKCLLIFNKLREVVFYDVDDEFVHVLRHKVALPLLRPQPLSSDDDVAAAIEYLGEPRWLEESILSFFAPFLASQTFLYDELMESYDSIEFDDGSAFVVKQVNHFVYLASWSGKPESFVRQWLRLCARLVQLLVGPCAEQIKHNPFSHPDRVLRSALSYFCDHFESVQGLQHEAIERVLVNDTLTARVDASLKLLTARSSKFLITPCHLFLVVNSRVVASYSAPKTYRIDPGDLILLSILSDLDECLLRKEPTEGPETELEGHDDRGDRLSNLSSASDADSSAAASATTVEHVHRPSSSHSDFEIANTGVALRFFVHSGEITAHPVLIVPVVPSERIRLIAVGEDQESELCCSVTRCIPLLNDVLSYAGDDIECRPRIHQVCQILDRVSHLAAGSRRKIFPPGLSSQLSGALTTFRQYDKPSAVSLTMGSLTNPPSSASSRSSELQLVGATKILLENLKATFIHLFSLPASAISYRSRLSSDAIAACTAEVLDIFQYLELYEEFLNLKSLRNFVVDNWRHELEGLVHFAFIDRKSNIIIAPPLDGIKVEDGSAPGDTLAAILSSIDSVHQLTADDADWIHFSCGGYAPLNSSLVCSYWRWYQDAHTGSVLCPTDELAAADAEGDTIDTGGLGTAIPFEYGVLAGDIFAYLVEQKFSSPSVAERIQCLELFCWHRTPQPNSAALEATIQRHAKRLVKLVTKEVALPEQAKWSWSNVFKAI